MKDVIEIIKSNIKNESDPVKRKRLIKKLKALKQKEEIIKYDKATK